MATVNRNPKTQGRDNEKKSPFDRLNVPVTIIATIITCVIGVLAFFGLNATPSPVYLETNGSILTRFSPAGGLGSVTQSVYFAPPARIQKALAKRPGGVRATSSDEAGVRDADALYHRGRYREAGELYGQLATKFPGALEISINLSVTLQLTGDFGGAVDALRPALRADAGADGATKTALRANLAQAHVSRGDTASARIAFQLALAAAPSDPVLLNGVGVLAYSRGNYARAVTAFRRAASNPRGLPAHEVNLAAAVLDNGDPSEADSLIKRLEERVGMSAESRELVGRVHLSQHEYAEARVAFAQARSIREGRGDIAYNLSLACASDRPDSAVYFYVTATREDPSLRVLPQPTRRNLDRLLRGSESPKAHRTNAVLAAAGSSPSTQASESPVSALPPQAPSEEAEPGAASDSPGQETPMPGGLKYTDLRSGNGTLAEDGKTLVVQFTAWLANGTKVDSSFDRGGPYSFTLGAGDVIRGWDEGLKGMRVGGKRTLVIPPSLAYGVEGRPPVIPANATLKFDVELIGVR